MRNRDRSGEPGAFRTGAYVLAIAVIAVSTLKAVLRTFVKTHNAITESRSRRAA